MSIFGDILGTVAKAAVGFVTGGPVGAVAGAASGIVSALGGGAVPGVPAPMPTAMPGGSLVYPLSNRANVSRGGAQSMGGSNLAFATAGALGSPSDAESAAGNPSTAAAGPGGLVCQGRESLNPNPTTKAGKPRKWRQTKNGGCTWHKKPSMNAQNPHAARRAVHRIKKVRRTLHAIEAILPHVRVHHHAGKKR